MGAGFPVVDVKATLFDGSYHDVDSSVLAFQIAARGAFNEGISKAGPQLLEPVMKVEVVCPEECMGDVIGDLNSRRGMVGELNEKPGGMREVNASVPLSHVQLRVQAPERNEGPRELHNGAGQVRCGAPQHRQGDL